MRPPRAERHHLYLASNLWDGLWIIQQPLCREIGRTERVLYVERFVSLFTILRYPRFWRRAFAWMRGVRLVEPNVYVLAALPLIHLGHRFPRLYRAEMAVQRRWILFWARRVTAGHRVLWVDTPVYESAVGTMGERLAVYHVGDEITAFKESHAETMQALEGSLLAKVDVVFAASEELARDKRARNPHTFTVWNAVDPAAFGASDTPLPADVASIPSPRVAFVGTIDDWVDIPLLVNTATVLPDINFVIVGPSHVDESALRALPNVFVLGPRPRIEIPGILGACKASLVPFVHSALTRRLVPLKVFEALAAGIMPVSTDFSPDLVHLARQDLLHIATDGASFAAQVKEAVASDTPARRERLSEYGLRQTWGQRWRQMDDVLENVPMKC